MTGANVLASSCVSCGVGLGPGDGYLSADGQICAHCDTDTDLLRQYRLAHQNYAMGAFGLAVASSFVDLAFLLTAASVLMLVQAVRYPSTLDQDGQLALRGHNMPWLAVAATALVLALRLLA